MTLLLAFRNLAKGISPSRFQFGSVSCSNFAKSAGRTGGESLYSVSNENPTSLSMLELVTYAIISWRPLRDTDTTLAGTHYLSIAYLLLLHGNVDDRCLTTQLDIVDLEGSWTGLSASQELDMQRYRMWLILLCEGGREVRLDYLEDHASHVAAIWNYLKLAY